MQKQLAEDDSECFDKYLSPCKVIMIIKSDMLTWPNLNAIRAQYQFDVFLDKWPNGVKPTSKNLRLMRDDFDIHVELFFFLLPKEGPISQRAFLWYIAIQVNSAIKIVCKSKTIRSRIEYCIEGLRYWMNNPIDDCIPIMRSNADGFIQGIKKDIEDYLIEQYKKHRHRPITYVNRALYAIHVLEFCFKWTLSEKEIYELFRIIEEFSNPKIYWIDHLANLLTATQVKHERVDDI
jgi:hypothetical protein